MVLEHCGGGCVFRLIPRDRLLGFMEDTAADCLLRDLLEVINAIDSDVGTSEENLGPCSQVWVSLCFRGEEVLCHASGQ